MIKTDYVLPVFKITTKTADLFDTPVLIWYINIVA